MFHWGDGEETIQWSKGERRIIKQKGRNGLGNGRVE